MITIHNINEHTLQEVYDQIALHLLTQGERAINEFEQCELRNDCGYTCAIGSLIPENDYSPSLEYYFLEMFETEFNVRLSADMADLLDKLRIVHDFCNPSAWENALKIVAEKMQLSSEVVSCFTH